MLFLTFYSGWALIWYIIDGLKVILLRVISLWKCLVSMLLCNLRCLMFYRVKSNLGLPVFLEVHDFYVVCDPSYVLVFSI